jgi:TetR/AcrR family tetracycline transcriptional repressor
MPTSSIDRRDIIAAAVEVLKERGSDGLTMRAVASRLGVSPIPLYTKVGDKNALLDAVAGELLDEIRVDLDESGPWPEQGERWAEALRRGLRSLPDRKVLLHNHRRWALVGATKPLLVALRAAGLPRDQSVRICRMLTWATVGFVAVETGVDHVEDDPHLGDGTTVAGGNPAGVSSADVDALFSCQIRFLIEGLSREVEELSAPTGGRGRRSSKG